MQNRMYYSQEAADRAKKQRSQLALVAFLLGAGVGAIITLLFAPESGDDMRDDLANAFENSYETSKDAVDNAVQETKKRVS